jgi:diguanylate cyclase (GGDEF)-like protein
MKRTADDSDVRRVLDELDRVIEARVSHEQRRDQLTRLGNQHLLEETINAAIDNSKTFWIAFLEVDKFKSINDRFGYQNADVLLQRVAGLLKEMADCFPRGAIAFRAHGDEFYLLGEIPSDAPHLLDTIHRELDHVRGAVASLRVSVDRGEMNCKMSVGWTPSTHIETPLTARGTLVCLERAVNEAKFLGRNRVVRYASTQKTDPLDSLRADCSQCRCKFSFDVKRTDNRTSVEFFCPNCGTRIPRPTEPLEPQGNGGTPPIGVVDVPAETDLEDPST